MSIENLIAQYKMNLQLAALRGAASDINRYRDLISQLESPHLIPSYVAPVVSLEEAVSDE